MYGKNKTFQTDVFIGHLNREVFNEFTQLIIITNRYYYQFCFMENGDAQVHMIYCIEH